MLDPTPSRNLKDTSIGARAAARIARRMPARGRFGNAAVFLAIFLAAGMVWAVADWAFRADAPRPVTPDAGNRARTARVDAAVKEILERPLFSNGRTAPPPPPAPEQLAALQRPVLKSHLTGITILADTRMALFAGDGNRYVSVREGDDIDGFRVKSILADRVILASAFGEQIVQPSRGLAPTVRNTKPIELGNFDPDKN